MNENDTSDQVLLQAWAKDHDRGAIGELVRRHIGFVHAVALRRVGGDEHLADDVTQAVFILLLRKADRIQNEAAMTSWLYTTTRYAANNANRMIRRRKQHEDRWAELGEVKASAARPDVAAENSDLQALLHEAIDQLGKTDRLCVVMSFMQQKTHGQVAAAMGISQEAARKRISRSIERIREFLASRRVMMPAADIGGLLAVKQAAVSAAFVQSTLNIALLSHSGGAAAAIAKGVTHMLFATRLKVAAGLLVGLTLTGLVAGQVVKDLGQNADTPAAAPAPDAKATEAKAADVNAPAAALPDIADLGDGVLVEFVGVSKYRQNQWHDIHGKPISAPTTEKYNGRITPAPGYQALVRVTCPDDADVQFNIGGGGSGGGAGGERGESGNPSERIIVFDAPRGRNSVDIGVQVADGPWKTVMGPIMATFGGSRSVGSPAVEATMSPLIEQTGKTLVYISTSGIKGPMRLVCIGTDGMEHPGKFRGGSSTTHTSMSGYEFDLLPTKVKSMELQTRGYNKRVTANGVALSAGGGGEARIAVDSAVR